MISTFYMPTRIVAGAGALATIGRLARELRMTHVLVVSDPVISVQSFHADALAALTDAGVRVARFDECGIDARCSHIDAQGERVRRDGIDGVVCIGGGSVMCTGKGVAIVATNRKPMRECTGVGRFDQRALPMIMVPTTAGSGSEVSQWTIVKDEERHEKLLGGGPLSFPDAAILDAATLRSLPMHVAALPAVDALTHGVEAYFSAIGSALTDAIALEAVRLQFGSLRASINADDEAARARNLMASCMANVACGNARLGHGHALSLPLEGQLDLPHPIGVGVLLPEVVAFNLAVLPDKVFRLAEALEVETVGLSRAETIAACAAAIRELYDDIGFPRRFTPAQVPPERVRELAARAVPGLYAGAAGNAYDYASAADHTVIACPSARKMTVAQAEAMFERCLGANDDAAVHPAPPHQGSRVARWGGGAMRILSNTTSPYARIARIALLEKGIEAATEMVNPWADDAALLTLNPAARVPTFETDNGRPLTESLLIVLWLERKVPEPSLLGADFERALSLAGRAMGVIDAMVHIVIGVLQLDPNWGETRVGLRRRRSIVQGMAALEADPPRYAGGTPDLAVLTSVVALDYLQLRFPGAPWIEPTPRLDALAAALAERPAYAATRPYL